MSDSVTKYFELLEEGKIKDTPYIYESPDGGKTVTRRPFAGDISEREVVVHPERLNQELRKQAYRLLTEYEEDVIRMAAKILDIGE